MIDGKTLDDLQTAIASLEGANQPKLASRCCRVFIRASLEKWASEKQSAGVIPIDAVLSYLPAAIDLQMSLAVVEAFEALGSGGQSAVLDFLQLFGRLLSSPDWVSQKLVQEAMGFEKANRVPRGG